MQIKSTESLFTKVQLHLAAGNVILKKPKKNTKKNHKIDARIPIKAGLIMGQTRQYKRDNGTSKNDL